MMTRRKICFVTPTMQKGGMERVIAELCNYLVRTNDVIIVCAVKGDVKYDLDERIKIVKNEYYKKYKIVSFLTTVIKKNKPDVVIGFSEFLNPYTIISSKLNRVKVYISDRSNPVKMHSFRDVILRKLTYPFADGLIAQTIFAKSIFTTKRYNKNIFILPNPLMQIKNMSFEPHRKGIVMTGRFTKTKNQKDLIEIFSKLDQKDWILYLVGDGKYKENLKKMTEDYHVSDRVIFTGEVADVEIYMNLCSIFAFTSISEGFPNALSEAIAYPLAPIAYNCRAGVSDLITDSENGFLIDEGSKNDFVKKLNILMGDTNLRRSMMELGVKNRDIYDVEVIAEQLLKNIF